MAFIKPFRALHYNSNLISQIENLICPAYDIIPDDEVQIYIQNHKNNIVNLEKPVGPDCYDHAGKTLLSWQNDGTLVQDVSNSIYIYEENFEIEGVKKSIRGIICLVKLEDFTSKVVIPHEKTHSNAKNDRFELLKATNCNFSPIFSLYNDDNKKITNIVNKFSRQKPFINFMDDKKISHTLWKISDYDAISTICHAFKNKKLYIADGHHRYETALNYKKYLQTNKSDNSQSSSNFVMMYLVDINSPGLTILPTHRMIKNISNFSPTSIIEQCENSFKVKKLALKDIKSTLRSTDSHNIHSIGFYFGGDNYFQLENKSLPRKILDVDILQDLILEPIFNLNSNSPQIQSNIDYTTDLNYAISAVKSNICQCAFIMNPTTIEQILHKTKNFEKMPQKSTYFYPKPITGLVINKIAD